MDQYATLRSRTESYLLNTNCNVEKLLVCVMDVQHVKCLASQGPIIKLENATTVSGVFLELVKRNLISFLQFSIIKRIIKDLCTECAELQEMLRVYQANFDAYIRRRVRVTEAYEEGRIEGFTSRDSEERVELVIVTDENWNGNTEFLRLLDLEAIVAQAVFPLTNEEWRKLAHHGIMILQCLGYLYTSEAKGTRMCRYKIGREYTYLGVDFTGNGVCVKTGDIDLTACRLHFLLVGRLTLEHGSEV